MRCVLLAILVLLSVGLISSQGEYTGELEIITPENFDRLDLLHQLPGRCSNLYNGSDEPLIATSNDEEFNLFGWNGELEYQLKASYVSSAFISYDGKFIVVDGDMIYDLHDGDLVHEILLGTYGWGFIPVNRFIAYGDAIYNTETWDVIVEVDTSIVLGQSHPYMAFDGVVYVDNGTSLELLLKIPNFDTLSEDERRSNDGQFAPDDSSFALPGIGVIAIPTGEILFEVGGFGLPAYSPNGLYVGIPGDGVYEVQTGEKIIVTDEYPRFDANSRFVIISRDGVYSLTTYEKSYEIDAPARPTATGAYVLIQDWDNNLHQLLEIETGKVLLEGSGIILNDTDELAALLDDPINTFYDVKKLGEEGMFNSETLAHVGWMGGFPDFDSSGYIILQSDFDYATFEDFCFVWGVPNDGTAL